MKKNQAEIKRKYEKKIMMTIQKKETSNNNNGVEVTPAIHQDIVIIGGRCGPLRSDVLNTVEKFSVVEGKSAQLPSMNQPRAVSASCVHNNDVIVAGGYNGMTRTNTIEILKMKQHPLVWTLFDVQLPIKLSGHAVVLYQEKLLIIGGYDWNEEKVSDAVFEVRLTPPYTSKLLVRMPQAVRYHSAKVVNDKLFVFGGTTTRNTRDATDSIVLYDAITNEFKPCASLPHAVWGMTTVTWHNMIIVIGGRNNRGQVLNDVIMYDTESGQSKKLPSMIYKRNGCTAVIMNDVIVVMGGWNDELEYLNSVETFTIGSDGWKTLPGMMEKRYFATAVVIPVN